MDAVEFLKQFNRMCKAYNDDGCKECPVYKYRCGEEFDGQEEDGVSIVEQWAKEHPAKTRQSEFLKQWPDTEISDDGLPSIAPCQLDVGLTHGKAQKDCEDRGVCDKCRHDFWLKEVHENEED